MHGDAVGIGHGLGVTPSVALAYAMVAAFLFGLSRKPAFVAVPNAVPAE
jgi:AGZA family xanthine/uracil permease-like MFS transporter